jgi:signal transduction histidine kinase
MLQHSRASTGDKEPTDINALVDEYLRLSYHGLRAKDKSFEAQLQTDFRETIGKVSVVPQDLGRVLLNLFNNAFYATAEKKKRLNGTYAPVVSVRTKRSGEHVEIQVQDNGTGISKAALGKIFQPFFTTKPTGEGTGLGLSLSYDIITKGHGGELTVESVEGEGATFVVRLPA